jgi:hypothetical protein
MKETDLTSHEKITEYLEQAWRCPFDEFFKLADMSEEDFKDHFEDKSPEEIEELIDEIVDQKIYSAQRAYATSLAEHNRSAT